MTFRLITILVISILIEWLPVNGMRRWAYTDWVPRIPLLRLSLPPIMQMLVAPPLVFLPAHKFLPLHKKDTP